MNIELNGDWWYEATAKKMADGKNLTINWGIGENPDMPTDYNIQKGSYQYWRPVGYSFFLFVPALFKDFDTAKIIWQILFYSFIPCLIFLFATEFFKNKKAPKTLAFIVAAGWIFYPKFLFSPLQTIDTWLISANVILSAVLIIKIIKYKNLKYILFFALSLVLLSFLRAYAVIPFIMIYLIAISVRKRQVRILTVFIPVFALSVIFYLFNYSQNSKISILTTNAGYNLLLGNNNFSNEFLRNHLGDCSSIEDALLPKLNDKFKNFAKKNEFEKERILTDSALSFIKNNSYETFENSLLKLIGFWSPLRNRDKSESALKAIVNFIVEITLLAAFFAFSLYSLITGYKRRNAILIIIFILLWSIPNLLFISSDRFRTPIEFIFLIFFVDGLNLLYRRFSNNKRSDST